MASVVGVPKEIKDMEGRVSMQPDRVFELVHHGHEVVVESGAGGGAGFAERESDPVAALLTMARGHAVFCRRDIARVAVALRLELSGRDHPVGREVEKAYELLVEDCVRLIEAGCKAGSIPPGPPARVLALAFVGAIEGSVIALAGQAPHDEFLAARAAAGVLGLDPLP